MWKNSLTENMNKPGPLQKKLLILSLSGLAIGLNYRPNKHFKIIKTAAKLWREIDNIDEYSLKRAIANLYKSKLVDCKQCADGSIKLTLSNKGKNKALIYKLDQMKIKKPKWWDKKWHLVIFDIPEDIRRCRDALRFHLKQIGFYELQRSVFIFPYNCQDEIEFLTEFYNIRKYVRLATLKDIDNELDLLKHFGLLKYRGF